MARIAAFPLALIISFALLAGAVTGVDWVMSHASHVHAFARPGYAIAIAETTSIITGLWLPIYFGVFAQKKKKEEESVRLTPLIRRSSVTGQREL